jgi:hypothetical protein
MSNPQQPELARSRKTPAQDQDAVAGVLEGQDRPSTSGPAGPIPEDNQPGHHPVHEQDKPDLDAFAARLGVVEAEPASVTATDVPRAVVPTRGRRSLVAVAVLTTALGVLGVLMTRRRRGRRR